MNTNLYARKIVLQNCGRFLHVSSDFGSKYKTHLFLTSEALYAGLTRELTRRARWVDLDSDEYDFFATYNLSDWPVWFTPGLFVNDYLVPLSKSPGVVDTNLFNVLDEDYPGTGGGSRKRKPYCPTYGAMEMVLPGRRLLTYCFSRRAELLEQFREGSVYLLGKKRTMFQIIEVSPVVACVLTKPANIWSCQVSLEFISSFTEYTVHAVTRRYLLISGKYSEYSCQAIFPDGMSVAYPEKLLPL
jgi:hypothetical protein